jgi:ABC-type amino acid transport substrate-binding protein
LSRRIGRFVAIVFAVGAGAVAPGVLGAEAPAPLSIVTMELTLSGAKDGLRLYEPVIDALVQRNNLNVKLVPAPPLRALQGFSQGNYDCLFSADTKERGFEFPTVQSRAVNRAYVYAFSAPGRPAYTSVESLKGKKIGTRAGYGYGKALDPVRDQFIPVPGDDVLIRRLMVGEFDAILAYMPDMRAVMARLPSVKLVWNEKKPLRGQEEAMICRDTAEGRALIGKVDATIAAMERSGELKAMLGPYLMEPVS